jgi:hypothetical protein
MDIEFKNKWWPKAENEDFIGWYNNRDLYTCELDEIFQKYNCDKANSQMVGIEYNNYQEPGLYKIPGHNYGEIYEKYFEKIRYDNIKILEFGVGNNPTNGYSMRAFLEYFPNATLTYLDWSYSNFNFNFEFDESRVTFHKVDQSSVEDLRLFVESCGETYDIIIDDCSHKGDYQYNTLISFFPKILKEGGYYFIEDIHDSEFLQYLPKIYDNLNNGNVNYQNIHENLNLGLSKITLYRSLICFEKNKKIVR